MRVVLRDDPGALGDPPVAVALDDDPVTVGVELVDDPNPRPDVSVLPVLSLKVRVASGFDDSDNPTWTWEDRLVDVPAVMWQQREQVDRRAGTTKVVATATVAYPATEPDVPETASVRTGDGRVWSVTLVARFPDRLSLTMERIDDGD